MKLLQSHDSSSTASLNASNYGGNSRETDKLPNYMRMCFTKVFKKTTTLRSAIVVYQDVEMNPIDYFEKKSAASLLQCISNSSKVVCSVALTKGLNEYLKNGVISSGVPIGPHQPLLLLFWLRIGNKKEKMDLTWSTTFERAEAREDEDRRPPTRLPQSPPSVQFSRCRHLAGHRSPASKPAVAVGPSRLQPVPPALASVLRPSSSPASADDDGDLEDVPVCVPTEFSEA
nr:(3S,6E)-nerolidol synthase 1, chloroplastic [Ipomoea batatas]